MRYSNITTVPKKGSRLELKNERGIFRVSVLRSILMRLIYNDKYPEIDENMSDCQMGARKGKGCKNNIFIINGIIHDVMKSKRMKPVLLQIYDYAQMFDSIDLEKAISDVYDAGVKDDNLALIYKANKEINMAVNTPSGLSERQVIKNSVLQGDTWGSILASVQVDSIGKHCEETGYGYLYKDSLAVSLLGLVDDMIGVTEAGFRAQQMNSVINVKTAEKGLQFGVTKCKSMLIGKNVENVLNSELKVDNWKVSYSDSLKAGEDDLIEVYDGKVCIDKTQEQRYLGFVLSDKGNNMVNINHLKKKSKGVIRRIFNRLESLNLQKYYLECAIIFLNSMLRSSILYASETYYNLKENEIRQLERIEEGFLRELLKTGKGCPIIQLYLEVGQVPARFEIIKMRLLFLKYILNQNQDSLIFRFFQLQLKEPVKGDWAATCLDDLKNLKIKESLEEIKLMSKGQFKNIVKKRISESAFIYLTQKQRKKGKEIKYLGLEMSNYLLPSSYGLSIDEKRKIFAMRNRMINIPANFHSKLKEEFRCICGQFEDMKHIYSCKWLNSDEPVTEYEEIFSDDVNKQVKVYRRFEENFEKREELLNENGSEQTVKETKKSPHVIHNSDPLFSVFDCIDYSNG